MGAVKKGQGGDVKSRKGGEVQKGRSAEGWQKVDKDEKGWARKGQGIQQV